MAKMINGTIWKILGFAVTLIALVGSIIYGYASMGHSVKDNCQDIADIKPKVDEHEKYIDGDKVDTVYIKRDIAEIKTMQQQILDEVRK